MQTRKQQYEAEVLYEVEPEVKAHFKWVDPGYVNEPSIECIKAFGVFRPGDKVRVGDFWPEGWDDLEHDSLVIMTITEPDEYVIPAYEVIDLDEVF